jgi:cytochrome c oxidase cbb3-type subunit 3
MRILVSLCIFALMPVMGLAATSGQALFSEHCAACHGFDGQGGVGIPLALPDFLAVADNEYLAKTIRQGRPGRVMPAFTQLTQGEIDSLIGFIRSWQPEIPVPAVDATPAKGEAAHGRRLFQDNCVRCHRSGGRGGAGTGVTFSRPRALPIMPPALDNPGFQAAASDQFLKRTLRRGRRGTPMPSFLEQGLSEQDLDDIVSYLRTLVKKPAEQWAAPAQQPAVLEFESHYSLQQTVDNLKQAIKGSNFRLINEHYLEKGLGPEVQPSHDQVVIFFCNFDFANRALARDPRVGLFLPCQVTVLRTAAGDVKVMAMNPKFMSRIYNNRELDEACNQMHDTYLRIMEEATL